MTIQIRYWFDSDSRDRTGDQIVELVQQDSLEIAAQYAQSNLSKPAFTIKPSFGPAVDGLVVLNTSQIRYVEIIPASPALSE